MPIPEKQSFGPLLLRQAVAMTRDARAIVVHAESIEMTALNSVFAARHAGAAGSGFGVISKELRGFSRELARQMGTLADAVSAIVVDLAGILNQSRRHALLVRAAAGDAAHQRLAKPLMGQTAGLECGIAAARDRWAAIARIIQRSMNMCRTGLHLARNARIEACQIAGMTGILNQVAADIAEAVESILALLATCAKASLAH